MAISGLKRQREAIESTPLLVSNVCVGEEGSNEGVALNSTRQGESVMDDAIDILKLGVPIAISYLSWIGVSSS
jgi:hypothetical protein